VLHRPDIEQANIPQVHGMRKHPSANRPSCTPLVDYNMSCHAVLFRKTMHGRNRGVPGAVGLNAHALISRRVFCSVITARSTLAGHGCGARGEPCVAGGRRAKRRSRCSSPPFNRLSARHEPTNVGATTAQRERSAVSHYHYALSRNSLSIA
jgi:hypothetical protein